MSSPKKVVRTELPKEEYEILRRLAEEENKSIKQVLREASNEYVDRHQELDPDDPFFTVDLGAADDEERTAKKTDEYLYRRSRPSASGLDPEGEGLKPR